MTAIRVIFSIVAAENLHLEQLDVKIAFLHGDLEEEIFMAQPKGQWYKKFNEFMRNSGFHRCEEDHCCYVKKLHSYMEILRKKSLWHNQKDNGIRSLMSL